jgi:hypothetical protein
MCLSAAEIDAVLSFKERGSAGDTRISCAESALSYKFGESDAYKNCRLFSIQHNYWSSRSGTSTHGVIWKQLRLLANLLTSIILPQTFYWIRVQCFYTEHDFNDFHPFGAVLIVLQLPGTGQKFNLMLRHAFDNVREADGIVDIIHAVVKKLKCCRSSKQIIILKRACAEAWWKWTDRFDRNDAFSFSMLVAGTSLDQRKWLSGYWWCSATLVESTVNCIPFLRECMNAILSS